MNHEPFHAFPGAVLECTWEHILGSGKCLPEHEKKKDQSILAQSRESWTGTPCGGVGRGFGLVPSYTTLSVRVRANINSVP